MNAVVQPQEWPALSHFSAKPLGHIRDVEQPESEEGWASPFKPHGLWVSVDGEHDWLSWCQSEEFGIGHLRYRIVLSEPERLLWLTTRDAVLDFTEQYDKPLEYPGYRFRKGYCIDWRRVAADWPGIIIAPYQWSLRLYELTHWYYGWDCASGCIWDANMIAEVALYSEDERNG